jgi:hypothetical protein
MSQINNRSNEKQKRNYFVRDDCDGISQLITCSAPQGYPTVVAAKEAKIKEIQEEIRFDLQIIGGLLSDIEKTEEQQRQMRLYCGINALLNEIEGVRNEQEKVRTLSL